MQENRRTLSQISKDQYPSEIYACDFMIDGQQLGFIGKKMHQFHKKMLQYTGNKLFSSFSVASDSDQNLVLYHYQPESKSLEKKNVFFRCPTFYNIHVIFYEFFLQCLTATVGSTWCEEVTSTLERSSTALWGFTVDQPHCSAKRDMPLSLVRKTEFRRNWYVTVEINKRALMQWVWYRLWHSVILYILPLANLSLTWLFI